MTKKFCAIISQDGSIKRTQLTIVRRKLAEIGDEFQDILTNIDIVEQITDRKVHKLKRYGLIYGHQISHAFIVVDSIKNLDFIDDVQRCLYNDATRHIVTPISHAFIVKRPTK